MTVCGERPPGAAAAPAGCFCTLPAGHDGDHQCNIEGRVWGRTS